METKQCRKCLVVKTIDCFVYHTGYKDNRSTWCKPCNYQYQVEHREQTRANTRRRRLNPEYRKREQALGRLKRDADVGKELFLAARGRAKKYGYKFTITIDDISIPEICPILEKPMIKRSRYAASIDKIKPELGYIPGNIQIISRRANSMKNDAPIEELSIFCTNMLKLIEKWNKQKVGFSPPSKLWAQDL